MIAFNVRGLPAAQGSKDPWGGEANKRLKPWRNDIAVVAERAMDVRYGVPIMEPVEVHCEFVFPRPKNHYGTGRNTGLLKASAPHWVAKAPDLDKLVRALGDAITGIVIRDDSQIACLAARKVYGDVPGVWVQVIVLREHRGDLVKASGGDVLHARGVERMLARKRSDSVG